VAKYKDVQFVVVELHSSGPNSMKFVTVPVRRDSAQERERERGLNNFRKSTKVHEQQFASLLSTTFHNSLYQINEHDIQFN
jgi:hypothetical protein